ncbi:MAG: DUF4159 domain-containing protein [Micavibrio aeruginosavorus]|uniref:DUF4159 domain-containing protein n=1 Tax=Micavibrio aeruginosavorus TaxID=349221 RepID=A0A7T5R1J3_9BACT|nr:MAG: DUF4159 domain-containing protein [Micavibrio aeruginosavorus]
MISGQFGTFAFLNPWVLAGLALLPLLWFLLRVTPPAPRLIIFPAARFMSGLEARKQVPSKTPWPILLLRILVAALIILALARPVLNPGGNLSGNGPVRIVFDNGWSSAQTWKLQIAHAYDLVERASRERRSVYIVTTTPEPGKSESLLLGPLTAGDAQGALRGLKPLPWLSDYEATSELLSRKEGESGLQSYWLSSGIADAKPDRLIRILQSQGGLTFYEPGKSQRPILLRPEKNNAGEITALIEVPSGTPAGIPMTLQAMTKDGRLIDANDLVTDGRKIAYRVSLDLPPAMQSQVSRLQLGGRQSAGSTLVTDTSSLRRPVGIVGLSTDEKAPLTNPAHYLTKALTPYADTSYGTIEELIERDVAVIILPDVGAMPPEDLDRLEGWVREGGLLLRFGGPNMTQGETFLTPVVLRRGNRSIEGTLSWDKPAKLAPFHPESPYYGLEIPNDLTISRQLLAEPEPELERKTWAALEDGTPLITADHLDSGLIVLIHTTATPDWSNLALSGLFVKLMERTVQLAGSRSSPAERGMLSGALQPLSMLDGYGNALRPDITMEPIPASSFEDIMPDSRHPPGIYGRTGYQKSLNLGARLPVLKTFSDLPVSVERLTYQKISEHDLMPFILMCALGLFLLDWLTMIFLHAGWQLFGSLPRWSHAALMALVIIAPQSARAETPEDRVHYAGDLYLAYIHTGVSEVDSLTQRGLDGLSQALTQRTSAEPAGIVALNPEADDLSFFPLIYWAITPQQASLSGKALQKIQAYLDHGGTILIDTRDQSTTPAGFGAGSGGANAAHLRRLLGNLNVPPLMIIPQDHVLTKSFYLLDSFPGRYSSSTLWIEETSASGRDGVSSLIIGSNDWISSWASSPASSTRQQEMSLRFGINVMMYALTGNYKADQVHIPHILERLGQ